MSEFLYYRIFIQSMKSTSFELTAVYISFALSIRTQSTDLSEMGDLFSLTPHCCCLIGQIMLNLAHKVGDNVKFRPNNHVQCGLCDITNI